MEAKKSIFVILLVAVLGLISACSKPIDNPETGRWYSKVQVELGKQIFTEYCAECHGKEAQGKNLFWKKRLPSGKMPPPPLNGTAHAWHHRLSELKLAISEGGKIGGDEHAFGFVLNDVKTLALIAFFQSYWSDQIYQEWLNRGGVK